MRFILAHQIEGRTRLRAEARPVDPLDLAELTARLTALPGVESVDPRPSTGSLVIDHPESAWEDMAEAIRLAGVIVVEPPEAPSRQTALAPLAANIHRADGLLREMTAGGVDLKTAMFVLLVLLGISQTLRGQFMVPAFSFLWSAFDILLHGGGGNGHMTDGAE